MEAVVQPSKLTPSQFLASVVTLCAVTTGIIALRLWSNLRHSGRVFVDDYLAVVGLVFLILNAASFYILLSTLNSDPKDVTVEDITTQSAIGIFAGNAAMYTAKLPLLFLYSRTFGVKKWLRWTCTFLVVFAGLGFLASSTYTVTQCSAPLHPAGGPPFLFTCITGVTHGTIARGSLSLVVDVILFCLPFPVLKNLNLPFRRKLGLALVFMAGLFAIAASALGLYYQTAQTGGTSSNFANALLITVVESCIVLLVSCTPSLHLFWTKHAVRLRGHLGLTRMSNSTNKSMPDNVNSSWSMKHKHDSRSMAVAPASRTRPSMSHQYYELRDSPHTASRELPPGAVVTDGRNYV